MDDLDPALLDRLDAAGFPWAGCTACPVVACHAPTCHNGRDRSARGVLWVCVVLFHMTAEPPETEAPPIVPELEAEGSPADDIETPAPADTASAE